MIDGKYKNEQIPEEYFKKIIGDTQIFYYKNNKYKSVLNGKAKSEVIYPGNDTLFIKYQTMPELYYIPVNRLDENLVSIEITKDSEKIDGYNCDLIEIKSDKGTRKIYFNNNFKLNPSYFTNHKYEFWALFLEKSNGCIAIKYTFDLEEYYMEATMVDFKKENLNDSIFNIPMNLKKVAVPINGN